MPFGQIAIIIGSVAMSAAGVAFALLAAASARKFANRITLAAGRVLLAVAALHLAPEAVESGVLGWVLLIVGVGAGIALETMFQAESSSEKVTRSAAWLAIFVLGLHSTVDGAVYSAAFWHDENSGFLTSLGLILHEAPEGIVAMLLALQTGLRTPMAVLVAFVASSLTTPVGWLLANVVGDNAHGAMSAMFAVSAGLLLYVGWTLAMGGWRAMQRRDDA
jgi:zinc and cadmium transporter